MKVLDIGIRDVEVLVDGTTDEEAEVLDEYV